MNESSRALPQKVGVWVRPDTVQHITADNIFDYMNGAGELYLGFGFDSLEVYEYEADEELGILVELYHMKSSNDAFGLLSLDWGGESVEFSDAQSPQDSSYPVPAASALYGAGLLRIWADKIYARVMSYNETKESKEAVLAIGRAITSTTVNPAPPSLLAVLPDTLNDSWQLQKNRISYFRSHLVLNSIYYLSSQNILQLDHSVEALIAPYKNAETQKQNNRVFCLFIHYKSPDTAQRAMKNFCDVYLSAYGTPGEPVADTIHIAEIEDGRLGYYLHSDFLSLLFEAPSYTTAQKLMRNIEKQLRKEAAHE